MTDEELERLLDERDVWRERAERAEAKLASITGMARQELARATAEEQREACAKDFGDWLAMRFHNDNNNNVPHDLIDVMQHQIRKTQLVTEEAP